MIISRSIPLVVSVIISFLWLSSSPLYIENSFATNHVHFFFGGGGPSPRVKETKATPNKWDLIELKIFYTAKETQTMQKVSLWKGENTCKQCN